MTGLNTSDANAFTEEQRRDWESMAEGWDRWRSVLEGPTAGVVQTAKLIELAGIGPGDSVLDVATGSGEPGLTVARHVRPGGTVTCSDISANMLAIAQRRAREDDLDNMTFVESAGEDLDFADESFNAVISRHGLQFLMDVPAALSRYRYFLKPEGRIAAIVWGPPSRVQFSKAIPVILEDLQLPPPPSGVSSMFALSDSTHLGSLFEDAGYSEVETGRLTVVYETERPEDFTQLVRDISPPITKLLVGQPPEVVERIWEKVTEAWRPMTDRDGITRIECDAIWVAGTK